VKIDPVLDWAERRTFWTMTAAGLTGFGVGNLFQGNLWGLLMLVPGLVLTAVRPFGTGLRRHALLRQARQALDENKRRTRNASDSSGDT
jgi:hypothetical protein